MDIVILANYTMDFAASDNGRFSYLANMLAEHGETVEIITSDFYHITKSRRSTNLLNLPYKVTFLHEPGYSRNVCLKRFYSHFVWGRNVERYLAKRKKPDVIYCAVPSLSGPWRAAKFCEDNQIRFVIDVQDLWPEAFKMIVNIPIISDILFSPFTMLANGIYKRADKICAVSETYVNRALSVNKKCKSGTCVFLGTDLDDFDTNANNNKTEKSSGERLRLAYCGTLGSSYDLTCVIDALAILKLQGKETPIFVVMGDGPEKERFARYAREKKVDTEFMGRLPYDQMCGVLVSCDIVVNPISHGAAQSIINKHADYAACGLPVLNTQECNEYRKLVKDYRMGYNCKNGNAEDLANKMYKLINSEELRIQMGKNARRCAEEKFNRMNSYHELIKVIIE